MSVFFLLIVLQASSLYAQSNFEDGLHYLPVRAPPFPTRPGRILLYAPFAIKSIKIKIEPLMEGLADKGHKVTIVMPHFASQNENITVINVEGAAEGLRYSCLQYTSICL